MINIEIPKENTWDLSEGNYRARIKQVKRQIKQTSRGAQEWVRLLFEVTIPSLSHLNCMAGRSLQLNVSPGSDLRNFLEGLLGRAYFRSQSGRNIDLESLCGMECEVQLEHFIGKNHAGEDYDKPLVVVSRMAPVGTLKLTEEAKD